MKNPVTYIGFFQHGQADNGSKNTNGMPTEYWNFYPVYIKGEDGRFKREYPNPSVNYGRLRLRQQWSTPGSTTINERNIPMDEIDRSLWDGLLVKATFDKTYFQSQYDGFGVSRSDSILLPPMDGIGDNSDFIAKFIQIESVSADEVLSQSSEWVEIVPLTEVTKANLGMKNICAAEIDRYLPSTQSGFRISLYDEAADLYSNPISLIPYHALSDLYLAKLDDVTAWYRDPFIDIIRMPSLAGDWIADPAGGYFDEEGSAYTTLHRVDPNAVALRGSLIYQGSVYKSHISKQAQRQLTSISSKSVPETSDDLVGRITAYLRNSGRDVTPADVINYCICITQGFITTFAGAPGTGKTTLCRLLSRALGLKEEDGQNPEARYAEIAVERGWSSLKDFIGYPDPFPKPGASAGDELIASNADACAAFSRMHLRPDDPEQDPPYLMLLDEANLSPIEYYWAQFLRNCQLDGEDGAISHRKIHVSQKEPWSISPNLRFLATVNFDHTTEELSPRFLDRTWVITLNAPDSMPKRKAQEDPAPVSMGTLHAEFGFPREGEEFPVSLSAPWQAIRDAFRDKEVKLPLSPRNTLAVEKYCTAAARSNLQFYITPEQALDFAVLQKILPTISGYGPRYEKLISLLRKAAEDYGLTKTGEKLADMEEAARGNSNFYQFFVR